MENKYPKIQIKNLRYNIALFAVATGISLHTIASAATISDTEITQPITTTEVKNETIEEQITVYYPDVTKVKMEIRNAIKETIENGNLVQGKEYSGMKLDHEYEDEIKKLTEKYPNVPYEVVLTIGYRESAGNWNNAGVISRTNDYGEFQINQCNLEYIEEKLGFTKEDLLNDRVKNAEACIFLLNDIIKRKDVDEVEEIFGMYNGWTGWRKKSMCVKYANACCEIINEYFPEFEFKKNQTVK